MSFELPASIEPQVQRYALAQHISESEAVMRLIQAGLSSQAPQESPNSHPRYSKMFGAAGGSHRSPEEIDNYVAELRSEWPD